jgi:hypothetical protein
MAPGVFRSSQSAPSPAGTARSAGHRRMRGKGPVKAVQLLPRLQQAGSEKSSVER